MCVSCGYLVGVNDDRCYHCGRRNPGLWGFAPVIRHLGQDLGFVKIVTGACVTIFALTLLWSRGQIGGAGLFNFLSPNVCSTMQFGASGAIPVFGLGRWWTVLSASWLHGSLLHILFNLLWIRQLAPEVGELYGPGRLIIIYTAAGVAGFTASSVAGDYLYFLPRILSGAPLTVGASASIFGLLGALVYYGRRTGSSVVSSQAFYWAVMLFVFGLVMSGVDNYAHAGGFAGGYFAARILDPMKPERVSHLAVGLGCLAASLLSVVLSFLVPVGPPFCF